MTSPPSPASRPGFTLIELLVVIAIIAILIGLLVPAVQKVREAASRTECVNNLKQISLACHAYNTAYNHFPHGGITEGSCCSTKSRTNWALELLPFLELQTLFDAYDRTQYNEDPVNAFVRTQQVKAYICPADTTYTFEPANPDSGPGSTLLYMPGSYKGVAGMSDASAWWDDANAALPATWRGPLHATWPGRKAGPEKLTNIIDGTSNTFLVGEFATKTHPRRRTFWAYTYTAYSLSSAVAESRTMIVDYDKCAATPGAGGANPCKRGWGSFHSGGILNFGLCDGSVRSVSLTIDLNLFTSLATIAGNEIIASEF